VIDDARRLGMIPDVSLRLLYLIFRHVLGLLLLRRCPHVLDEGRRTSDRTSEDHEHTRV